jgi:hypothetical protein
MQSQEPTSLWMDTSFHHLWKLDVDDHESQLSLKQIKSLN